MDDRSRSTIPGGRERARARPPAAPSEAALRSILDNIQEAVYRTDTDGRIRWASPSCQRLWGYAPDAVIGTFLADYYVDPGERARFLQALERGGGTVTNYEARMRPATGGTTWVSTNAHYYRDAQGRIAGIEGTVRDVSEFRRVRDALAAEKERAQVTLASIGEGIITTDPDDRIRFLNPAAERLTGWDADSARGQLLYDVYRLRPGADPDDPGVRPAGSGTAVLEVNGGGERFIEQTCTSLNGPGDGPGGRVIVFRDVTALRRMQRQLSYQATHDALTGLVNRYEFERRLQDLVDSACRGAASHALLYVDLDDFKAVNDTCGHLAGDDLLRRVSARLRRGVRESDTVARLGGDEFGVLLARCPLDKAEEIARQVLGSLRSEPFLRDGRTFEIVASIGVVPVSGSRITLTGALGAADRACYLAKELGGNRVRVCRPSDRAPAQLAGNPRWLPRLEEALRSDRLCLCVQDAMSLRTPVASGYREVRVQMRGPGENPVPARAFLPAAERYHLLPRIDRWVLRHALARLAERASGTVPDNAIVALNLSGQSIRDEEFLQQTLDLLGSSPVPPSRLCFEIAETALTADFGQAMRFMTALRQLHCRLALDHFGSGTSSITHLRHLPVDFVKLDAGLVRSMTTDTVARGVVEAVNRIAHLADRRTIATAVNDPALLDELEASGVDYAQGSAVAAPRPFP